MKANKIVNICINLLDGVIFTFEINQIDYNRCAAANEIYSK